MRGSTDQIQNIRNRKKTCQLDKACEADIRVLEGHLLRVQNSRESFIEIKNETKKIKKRNEYSN